MKISPKTIKWRFKPLLFLVMSLPGIWLGWQLSLALALAPNDLTANPIEFTNRFLGDWALRYLYLTLAITPLCALTGSKLFMHFRRMIGLFAFAYALLHLASYVGLDHYFNWAEIWQDIIKRNFITLGFISIMLLVPLAVSSTSGMIKRMGAARWKKLHMLIYPVSILVTAHYWMMVRGDQLEPKVYAAILSILLGWRAVHWLRQKN